MKIIVLDDQIQELTTDTCGIFQLYFYKDLFDAGSKNKILNDEIKKKKNSNNINERDFFTK